MHGRCAYALALLVVTLALVGLAGRSQGTGGSLDGGFGAAGRVTVDLGGIDGATSVAREQDGKLVVAGYSWRGSYGRLAVTRLAAAGTLDRSFGSGGKTVVNEVHSAYVDPADDRGELALEPGGIVLLADFPLHYAVVRLRPSGRLDRSFGVDGQVPVHFDGGVAALVLQPDGSIVVAGRSNGAFSVRRLLADGTVDQRFGSSGTTRVAFGVRGTRSSTPYALALQPDGKVLVAGNTFVGVNPSQFAIARLTATGRIDGTFGVDGTATVDFGASDTAEAVAVQPDGKVVVAGWTASNTRGINVAVARLDAHGVLDESFGTAGETVFRFTKTININQIDRAFALAIQSDAKIVIAGWTSDGRHPRNFAVARLDANGRLDASFGTHGETTIDFGGSDRAFAVALQPGDKIVVAGLANGGGSSDFGLARLLGSAG